MKSLTHDPLLGSLDLLPPRLFLAAHVAFVGFIEAHRSAVRARTRAAREVSRLKKRVALLEVRRA